MSEKVAKLCTESKPAICNICEMDSALITEIQSDLHNNENVKVV